MTRLAVLLVLCTSLLAQSNPRARGLGVPFEGTPGPFNAITDVKGVTVGHATVIEGKNVRTGVTAILPRGMDIDHQVFAGWWSLNGNGEMTGTTWVEESGFLDGPVMITNTHSVGVVRDAVIQWRVKHFPPDPEGYWWSLPVVAETWDGWLNDINGFHVKPEHAWQALESANSGPVVEGNVGGGTGMICHEFKGGIGTSSRLVRTKPGDYAVGVLVQCNYGRRHDLRIAGVPLGAEIADNPAYSSRQDEAGSDRGSIIVVVATDAPLVATQLKRLARRVSLGLGRNGSISGNGSGDIFIAFSTANPNASAPDKIASIAMLPNSSMDDLFAGTVQAVEEAIVNAMVAAETMSSNGHTALALPHDRLREVLKKYNRLAGK